MAGLVKDGNDGSYTVVVVWDPDTATPGVIVQQPDRPSVPVVPGGYLSDDCRPDCNDAAGDFLGCLGLHDPNVKRVQVKSVCIEVDLEQSDCEPPCKGKRRKRDKRAKDGKAPRDDKGDKGCGC